MADTKISELAAASALDGTELVPVVQGGATKRTTVDDVSGVRVARASITIDDLIAAAQIEIAPAPGALKALLPVALYYKMNNPDAAEFSLDVRITYASNEDGVICAAENITAETAIVAADFPAAMAVSTGFAENDGIAFRRANLQVVASSVDIVSGGTGYAVGDTGSIDWNEYSALGPQYEVTAVDGGAITALTITAPALFAYDSGLPLWAGGAQAGVGTDGVVIPTAAVGGDTTAIDVLIVYTVMAFSDSGGMPVPEV